jgi:hypothetical protein
MSRVASKQEISTACNAESAVEKELKISLISVKILFRSVKNFEKKIV